MVTVVEGRDQGLSHLLWLVLQPAVGFVYLSWKWWKELERSTRAFDDSGAGVLYDSAGGTGHTRCRLWCDSSLCGFVRVSLDFGVSLVRTLCGVYKLNVGCVIKLRINLKI